MKITVKVAAVILLILLGIVVVSGRYRITDRQPEQPGQVPQLESVDPASGAVGTVVTLSGSGFRNSGNVVVFGQGYINDAASADGTTLTFTVPDGLDLCAPGMEMCPQGYPKVIPGRYPVKVQNENGISNEMVFTVTEQ